jgi:murein DD-endopeptidase MepM/ murein hydrolase activator NlpD
MRVFKNLAIYLGTVAFSLITVVVSFSLIFGSEATTRSISMLLNRVAAGNQARTQAVSQPQSLIQTSEGSYASINLGNVAPVAFEKRNSPFIVPTTGVAANAMYVYNPPFHVGVDIWANEKGRGLVNGSSRGYPVYASCAGYVTRVYLPNGEVEIVCDPIDPEFTDLVPSLKVKTLYAHMADAITHEPYLTVHVGQRIEKGQQIGVQGNLSSITPVNRVTHLHFGIYDLSKSNKPTLNPAPYIGVPTTLVGQIFKTEQ